MVSLMCIELQLRRDDYVRAVVQRVSKSSVRVDNRVVGKINKGLLVLLGVEEEDDDKDLKYIVDKVTGLRIFEDENEKMNLSVVDIEKEILIVSQFTLYGDVRKGKRPNFMKAATPRKAEKLYEGFIDECENRGINIETGVFGEHMEVDLVNDGPVTILLDSNKEF